MLKCNLNNPTNMSKVRKCRYDLLTRQNENNRETTRTPNTPKPHNAGPIIKELETSTPSPSTNFQNSSARTSRTRVPEAGSDPHSSGAARPCTVRTGALRSYPLGDLTLVVTTYVVHSSCRTSNQRSLASCCPATGERTSSSRSLHAVLLRPRNPSLSESRWESWLVAVP